MKYNLSSCLDFSNGKIKPKNEGEFPVYGASGILGSSDSFNAEDCIVIGRVGCCGSLNFVKGKCWVSDNAIKAYPKPGFDLKYLYYFLHTLKLDRLKQGTTQPLITQGLLKSISIDELPSYQFQVKVSNLLSMLDNKIKSNNLLNDYLDDYATSVFNMWLSQCREFTTIGEIAEEILDYTKQEKSYVKLINSSDVTEGVFPNPDNVENKNLKGHFKKRFKKYDILYSEIRPRNHHYGYVMFDPENWISTTRLMVIRKRPNKVSSALLYYYLKSNRVTEEFTVKTETRSGTFPQGKYADMASITVPYSDVKTQLKVSDKIQKALKLIHINHIENEKISSLRDALLPKLMSGEINVSKIKLSS